MKKNLLWLLALLMGWSFTVSAQSQILSGKVYSDDDKLGLPGTSVSIKGTTIGTTTDSDGQFKLTIPAGGATLIVSFIGYIKQEVTITTQTSLEVYLKPEAGQLTEVVVTALGIQREKKALGYAQQSLSGKAVAEVRPANVANALSGKVAGLRIQSGTGPGSGSTIQIRGASSITNNNQPLIVVDGVPIEQSFSKRLGGGIADINPENIKDISVLKGPSASALYGSRAANGVILVTTKDGSGQQGIGIEVNTNYTVERPWISPNFQNTYGGGNGYRTWYHDGWSGAITDPNEIAQYRAAYGPYAPLTGTEGTDESWGAPMDGRLVRQWWTGTDVAPLVPMPHNYQDFWQTGSTWSNNIAISGGNDKGSFRLGLGRLDQKGIMYYNDYHRNNYKLNTNYNFTPKLNVSLSAEYIQSGSGNRGYSGGQEFIWSHRQTDWNKIRNWRDYTSVHIQKAGDGNPPNWQHTFFTNPYYIQEMLPSSDTKDRLVGNMAMTYKILPDLSVMLRSGTDLWTQTAINVGNFERVRNGTRVYGAYSEEVIRRQENNTDVIFTYKKDITEAFSLNATAGALLRTNYYKRNYTNVGQLVVDRVYNLANSIATQNTVASRIERKESQSVFGAVNLGWQNMLFLDLTARNDWSSTLPASNRSYFYPSAALSAVVSDMVPSLKNGVLSFLKVRGSLAQVGNDTDPYRLMPSFTPATSWNGSLPEFFEPTRKPNNLLKPEITTGQEAGLEARFFRGRLGLDVTYYSQTTKDQIIPVQLSKATGYNEAIQNIGKMRNRGIEISITGTPLKLKNGFTWDVSLNLARNRNMVIELLPGVLNNLVINERRGLTLEARAGQPYGTLYGYGFERVQSSDPSAAYYDPSGQYTGQLVLNNGLPVRSTTQKILGNVQPKWTGGFSNTFSFKGFILSALIDAKIGGDMYDEGTANARWTGQYAETAIGREEGVIGQGVSAVRGADGGYTFTPNSTIVAANQYYGYNNPRNYHEAAIFDASYVKLREVSFGYQIPSAIIKRLRLQSARLSVVGRNVAMLFRNHPHADPEIDANGGNAQGFGYGELPSSRSMGFNLSLGF
ncbi:SusC/RagA family TonB-linked outer membrane protein [Siphonobacter sp. SORGH_AS_1065]|uniref:SusC/RagA family TonB-linked outer membrane protein n=1 Tax=Siphonobacter sp. SORGH_AS_1065 TaxID=3041795 RepID=UPI00277EE2B4|nr:SusC/RagA family TonB-linked outer membrane protein [Siphonobacter sp. SORGH_AS_1065]MDQ1088341.1 TonB-linked SusC/RagA family outer membrane protein [Siphonobacter sp. SORGH_AS_1065]